MGFAYHGVRDLYFMYGGRSDTDVALDDTWQFSPVTGSWTLLPADTGTGRSSTRMVYNPTLNFPLGTSGVLVLYGGNPLDANTRFYDGSPAGDWQLCAFCVDSNLELRASEGLAYDSSSDIVVMHAGTTRRRMSSAPSPPLR
jgi:hypothetical protein